MSTWSQTFDSAPLSSDYSIAWGSSTAVWNEAESALDVSTPTNSYNLVRFSRPLECDFWFEADIELISQPIIDGNVNYYHSLGFRYLGIHLSNGSSMKGWRLEHYHQPNTWHDSWYVEHLPNADFSGPVEVYHATADDQYFRRWWVGGRNTLRVEYRGHPTRPTERLMHWYINGALFLQTQHSPSMDGNLVQPGVFFYGGTIRIHSVSGGSPSGLPDLGIPDYHAERHIQMPLEPLVARQGHEPTNMDYRFRNFERNHSPVGSQWNLGIPIINNDMPGLVETKNVHFHGLGSIVGTVKLAGTPSNTPLRRRVQLMDQRTSLVVCETWSTEAGDYRFDRLDTNRQWTVLAWDWKNHLRAVLSDNLRAVAV